jgi:hypothetical protein
LGAVAGKLRSTLGVRSRRARRLRSEGVFDRLGVCILGEPPRLLDELSRMMLNVLVRLREPEVEVEGGED